MLDVNMFDQLKIGLATADQIRIVVARRGEEARDDQLPHAASREGRPVLREDLRPDPRLGVLLRQVQAGPLQGHHLRALRRRGHPLEGAPRAHGPHRARRARRAHLVPARHPLLAGLPARRHRAEGRAQGQAAREGHLLRRQPGHLGRRGQAPRGPVQPRGRVPRGARRDPARSSSSRSTAATRSSRTRPRRAEARGRRRHASCKTATPRRTSRAIRERYEIELDLAAAHVGRVQGPPRRARSSTTRCCGASCATATATTSRAAPAPTRSRR